MVELKAADSELSQIPLRLLVDAFGLLRLDRDHRLLMQRVSLLSQLAFDRRFHQPLQKQLNPCEQFIGRVGGLHQEGQRQRARSDAGVRSHDVPELLFGSEVVVEGLADPVGQHVSEGRRPHRQLTNLYGHADGRVGVVRVGAVAPIHLSYVGLQLEGLPQHRSGRGGGLDRQLLQKGADELSRLICGDVADHQRLHKTAIENVVVYPVESAFNPLQGSRLGLGLIVVCLVRCCHAIAAGASSVVAQTTVLLLRCVHVVIVSREAHALQQGLHRRELFDFAVCGGGDRNGEAVHALQVRLPFVSGVPELPVSDVGD
mmetsp:Transcript_20300/g.49311  ORF Transcript_20300/g.49311 Transcript_20300/m.49311 type:complete len:316 (-) Transcript_20300:2131-3078(-)